MLRMNLRTKLTITHTAVVLLAITLVVVVATAAINRYFNQLADAQARDVADTIATPLAECYAANAGWPPLLRRCWVGDAELRRSIAPRPNRRVMVADAAGQVLFDSGDKRTAKLLSDAERKRSVPIVANGATVGAVLVVPNIGQYGAAEDRFLLVVRRSVLIAGVGAGLLALLFGGLLAQGVTKPLRALTSAVHRLARGDTTAHVIQTSANDEVGELSRAFNTLSAELRRSEETRRQMVADIAHELRTPLSVLKLELESIEDGVSVATPAVVRSLNEEVDVLSRLVDDLRTLSLADAGQLVLQPTPLAVGALIERIAGRMQVAAHAKQITVTTSIEANVPPLHADPLRLGQVIGNLLQNAVRYTPLGGQISVEAHHVGGEIVFSVRDTGPGFAPAEAAAIFERFYRTDTARARDTGGSGLGLAIVRGLVQAMNGRVWATSQPNHGATFYVALPAT